MRVAPLLIALLMLLAVAGCGGGDELAPQTPGDPAAMPVPEADQPPGGDNADEPADEGADTGTEDPAEPDADADTATPPDDQSGEEPAAPPETAAAPEDTGGGTTAPPTDADGPANDTPPPAGSDAEQFEDFCAQNPGAC